MGIGDPTVNNTIDTIDLVCKNGANDAPPYWDPPYDHLVNPFPECVFIREYILVMLLLVHENVGERDVRFKGK